MKTEFKKGDLVTFAPYEIDIPAKVLNVRPQQDNDNRVFYDLTGTDYKRPLTSTCTGRSIKESKLYKGEIVHKIKCLEDLPEGKGYFLPGWHQQYQYRATAWAYLNRDDGGKSVLFTNGERYTL